MTRDATPLTNRAIDPRARLDGARLALIAAVGPAAGQVAGRPAAFLRPTESTIGPRAIGRTLVLPGLTSAAVVARARSSR